MIHLVGNGGLLRDSLELLHQRMSALAVVEVMTVCS